jgi:hypothetical protein
MGKLSAFIGVLVAILVTYFLWWNRFPPFDGHGEPVPVAVADVKIAMEEVQVQGTAHYATRLSRTWPKSLFREKRTLWFFPLFAPKDIEGRKIHVMVASDDAPDRFTNFEDLVVEGWARPPAARMDAASEQAFRDVGYTYDETYVLIETFGPAE